MAEPSPVKSNQVAAAGGSSSWNGYLARSVSVTLRKDAFHWLMTCGKSDTVRCPQTSGTDAAIQCNRLAERMHLGAVGTVSPGLRAAVVAQSVRQTGDAGASRQCGPNRAYGCGRPLSRTSVMSMPITQDGVLPGDVREPAALLA